MLKTITINTDTHKVVPLEPTQEMEDAGRYSRDCQVSGSDKPEDIYKAMLAAAPEYTQSWLPIETAPKDGTKIDVWNGFERISNVFWGECDLDCDFYYLPKGVYDFCVNDPDLLVGCCRNQQVNAKFWMPLPPAHKSI